MISLFPVADRELIVVLNHISQNTDKLCLGLGVEELLEKFTLFRVDDSQRESYLIFIVSPIGGLD